MTVEEMYLLVKKAYRRCKNSMTEPREIFIDGNSVSIDGEFDLRLLHNGTWVTEGRTCDLYRRMMKFIKKNSGIWIDDELSQL